ncbi:MAG: hypothetical protein QOF48_1678, partial [Verrucomicrobiota bacterium]
RQSSGPNRPGSSKKGQKKPYQILVALDVLGRSRFPIFHQAEYSNVERRWLLLRPGRAHSGAYRDASPCKALALSHFQPMPFRATMAASQT